MTSDTFSTFTLRRPITVLMALVMMLLSGAVAYVLLPVELLPRGFADSEVSIIVLVPNGNPAEVQEQVIRPAEEQIRTISGISKISTRARSNGARLQVSFSRDVDLDLAVAEVRDRIERARPNWPAEVRDYAIFRFNLDTDLPLFSFAIDLAKNADDLTVLIEENIVKPIEALPGVAQVEVWGLLDNEIRIVVDRGAALANRISIYELGLKLRDANLQVSGGQIEDGGVRYTLEVDARFQDLDQIRNFPLNREGLRLHQIAEVVPKKAVRQFMALSRNERSLWCQVKKESSANTVETARIIRTFLRDKVDKDQRLKELGATLRIYDRMDFGRQIEGALASLGESAWVGGLLAMAILIVFLRRLSLTLIVTASIPLSMLLTLSYLYFSGGSLNILSLLGLTIAIGMLVDNSIVIVENIARFRDLGFSSFESAKRGAGEVALPISLSTLTTVAAFLPLIFMGGKSRITFFTSGIGIPLCAAVVGSLIVALVFIPLATIVFFRTPKQSKPPRVGFLAHTAGRGVLFVLRNRLATLVIVGSLVVGLAVAAWKDLPKANILSDAGGRIGMGVTFDQNFSLNDAYDAMRTIGTRLNEVSAEFGIEHFWCWFNKRSGDLSVELKNRSKVSTKTTAAALREKLPTLPGVDIRMRLDEGGQGDKNKENLDLSGPDPERLVALANEVCDHLEGVDGVLSATSDLQEAEEEIHVRPDRDKAARFGIEPRLLQGTIQFGIRGWPFSDIVLEDREVPLVIEYDGADDRDLPNLRDLPILTPTGSEVRLSSVASLSISRGLGEIRRQNGRAFAHITIETAAKDDDACKKRLRSAVAVYPLPEGYSFSRTDDADMKEATREMKDALVLAVVFVFLLMGILFESFVLPFAVLITIPFSWAGAIWALALTKTPLDFVGAIGVLVLVGVVVNNGIVLIDCAHRLRAEGKGRTQALREAAEMRLRAILMTALTTIVGLIPMAISDGGGSEISYKALSRLIMGGMIVATFFTVFFVPLIYSLIDDLRAFVSHMFRAMIPNKQESMASSPRSLFASRRRAR